MALVRRRALAWASVLFVGIVAACSGSGSGGSDGADGGPGVDPGGGDGSVASSEGGGGGGPPVACKKGSDCASGVCGATGFCLAPTSMDGVKNGTETDIDCGGGAPTNALACADGKACLVGADCKDSVCKDLMDGKGLRCQPPTNTDGVKNGNETGVDCGGAGNPACPNGQGCAVRADCTSNVCLAQDGGPLQCVAPSPADGIKDGTETDVDCGGPSAPPCVNALMCKVAADCVSIVCKDTGTGLRCQPATSSDGVKNGLETDVDCGGGAGGTNAPACAAGKTCVADADCRSAGCSYAKKCTITRSCVPHWGGDTCGQGEPGQPGSVNEECCATAQVTADKGLVNLGKYPVTSGRMRQFITSVKGDVRTFMQGARAAGKLNGAPWDPGWEAFLPTALTGCEQDGSCAASEVTDYSMYEANNQLFPDGAYQGLYSSVYRLLGGTIFHGQGTLAQGCRIDAPGTHTYYMDAATQHDYFGDLPTEYDQTVYDQKAQNCVPFVMAQAFCVWDGGRLETFNEWLAAWGPAAFPWGAAPTPVGPGSSSFTAFRYPTLTTDAVAYADYNYSYEYPSLKTNDYVVFIDAPGRMKGRGPAGHADVLGPMMEVTSTMTTQTADPRTSQAWWTSNGSWEGHGYQKSVIWNGFTLMNKYGKQGLRCAYPTLP